MSRWVVLSWIREVVVEHKLSRQAYHLAIMFLDILLSTEPCSQEHFQLMSVTALMVALKTCDVEQLSTAGLVEFVYDEEKTPDQNRKNTEDAQRFLMKYEYKLMKTMKWDVMIPTAIDFLEHAFQFAAFISNPQPLPFPENIPDLRDDPSANTILHQQYDTMLFARAASIVDKAVMDYHSLKFAPSEIAASAFWRIYSETIDAVPSDELLVTATGYTLSSLQECLKFLEPFAECDIYQIFHEPIMIEAVQKWQLNEKDFRLEQDQIPFGMGPVDYGTGFLI
jgi:hypothetical protein